MLTGISGHKKPGILLKPDRCTSIMQAYHIHTDQSNCNHMCHSAKPIVCTLTTQEMQNRKATVIQELKDILLSKEDIASGYRYKFSATDLILDRLINFIKMERMCCEFFKFSLLIEDGYAWLMITGPEGAKEFLKHEIDF
jgi:hypothetical protein